MKRTILFSIAIITALSSAVIGQDTVYDTRTFKIKHRSAQEIYEMIEPFLSDARGNDRVSVSQRLQSITVHARKEKLDKIAKTIDVYDTPLKQVWIEVLLVEATGNGHGSLQVPRELKEVASQLKSVFNFKKYTVIGRANAAGIEGKNFHASNEIIAETTQPGFRIQGAVGILGDTIQLQQFTVHVDKPVRSNISTTINVPDGKIMILGATETGNRKSSLITVVKAGIMKQAPAP